MCYVYAALCGYSWSIPNRNELTGSVGIEVATDKTDNDNIYDVSYSSKRLTPNDPLIAILKSEFFFEENELCVGVLQ